MPPHEGEDVQYRHFHGRYRARAYTSNRELFSATGIETVRQWKATYRAVESYQFKPGDILVAAQITSEIRMIHKLEDKSKRMFSSGINRNERYEILVIVVKTTAHQRFPVQPLSVASGERKTFR